MTYTRTEAIDRAIATVTLPPLDMRADDAATVVHVTGHNPVCGNPEDCYIALGGAHDQTTVDRFYRDTDYSAVLVAVFYREGPTIREALDAAL